MKLLRLTTENSNGIFDSSLDQELTIEPNSQMALGSAALELLDKGLEITSANNKITFQVSNGVALAPGSRTTRLTPGVYNSSNFLDFFTDFNRKLNSGLGKLETTPGGGGTTGAIGLGTNSNEIGKQWRITKGEGQDIVIACNQSPSHPLRTRDLDKHVASKLFPGEATTSPIVVSNTGGTELASGSKIAFDNDNYFCSYANENPITRGCGIHRVRIKTLANRNTAGGADPRGGSGFSISLHNDAPTFQGSTFQGTGNPLNYLDQRSMNISDIKYGIRCESVIDINTGQQTGLYKYIIDGKLLSPGVDDGNAAVPILAVGADDTKKDVVSLEIVSVDGQKIVRGCVYKAQQASPLTPSCKLLFTAPYQDETLFGSYTFHGGGLNQNGDYGCRVNAIRWTADPYIEGTEGVAKFSRDHVLEGEQGGALGSTTPVFQNTGRSNHSILFDKIDIPEWLGYDPPDKTLAIVSSSPVAFRADLAFSPNLENDCFLLEMLNLPIDSYDYEPSKKKRMNLLSVFPFDDSLGKCIYDPNNLIFLDLRNKEKLRLRDIRCRILRSDYSEVNLTGVSSLVIYVKGAGEKIV